MFIKFNFRNSVNYNKKQFFTMLKKNNFSTFTFAKFILVLPFFVFLLIFNCNAQGTKSDVEPPFRYVSEPAEPLYGYDSLYKFIQENLRLPEVVELSKKQKKFNNNAKPISAQVFVEFVIEIDGSISNVRVLVGANPTYDEEAIRVIKMLPNWKPAKHNGKLVRSFYSLPVRFMIN
jgi:hypothetical protein